MDSNQLMTPWGETLDPQNVLGEYPRPQMVRDSYENLNGYWECAFTAEGEKPDAWQRILVPFSPEAPLSGVNRALKPEEVLWYRRSLPKLNAQGGRVLLHFGAVDQQAEVLVNSVKVAEHLGGYTPFSADITDALKSGEGELLVRVKDDSDSSWHSRGKQKTARGNIWYTPQSGIWQTVWMERVPANYITDLHITPLFEQKACRIIVNTNTPAQVNVAFEGKTYTGRSGEAIIVTPQEFIPWHPDEPHLYDFEAACGEDRVKSYFALRSICVKEDEFGVKRLHLNGEPYFHVGMLDQGYWPDGLYTAPSDEALIYDIQLAKDMGFNMLRKHIKIEPLRWYYHCDRLGMLVWQDMINGGRKDYNLLVITAPLFTGLALKDSHYSWFKRQDAQGREEYYKELDEMIRHLYNCPSIVMWVPFNEGWGQFDAAEAVRRIKTLDTTRTIDHASGWHDQGIGDFKSLHVYFKPYKFSGDKLGRCEILTEFGGYSFPVEGHLFNTEKAFGYKKIASLDELAAAYQKLYDEEIIPVKEKGLSATVYTQVSDVEDEINGVVTYDRKVVKFNPAFMRAIHGQLQD
ncbi:MAG: glycoside hydrolase family 2 [Clostridia bacterium]|nr:glycoside hydrolase family 2 [Clostridia bacterium]